MRLSPQKRVVAVICSLLFVSVLVTAVLMERPVPSSHQFVSSVPVQLLDATKFSSDSGKLRADVKGSIYQTGSNMTVYGACYDGDGFLLPAASASFAAWFPDGSVMLPEGTLMQSVNGSGRWLIHVTMVSTIGTYLTEFRCDYGGEYATALGEWQNPEWVQGIVNTSANVVQLQSDLQDFRADTASNFSEVISMLGSLNTSFNSSIVAGGDQSLVKLKELYNAVSALPKQFWVLDGSNPSFSFGSGLNSFRAVDMVDENNICAVGLGGVAQCWDGSVWSYTVQPDINWHGVSVLAASSPYAWFVGSNGTAPFYSINGAAGVVLNTSSSDVFDVRIIRQPNSPASTVSVFVLGNGEIVRSDDLGVSWTSAYTLADSSASYGRLSDIVWNSQLDSSTGYRFAAVTSKGELIYYDGSAFSSYLHSGVQFVDVSLLYPSKGYIVGHNTTSGKNVVWSFSGGDLSSLRIEYVWDSVGYSDPKGVAAPSSDDVWVVTSDPSVFYHYDGFKWSYRSFPYSSTFTVSIGFGNITTSTGIQDITMFDGFNGYAVGDDGLVLKLENKEDAQFKNLLQNLSAQITAVSQSINFTPVLNAVQEVNLTSQQTLNIVNALNLTVYDMNLAMDNNFTSVIAKLNTINLTVNLTSGEYNVILGSINSTVNTIESNQVLMQSFLNAMNSSMTLEFADIKSFQLLMNQSISSTLDQHTLLLQGINTSLQGLNVNLTPVMDALVAMNSSISSEFSVLSSQVSALNISTQESFSQVLANQTYTNVYMATTIYPALNSTYQNTLQILVDLGIIKEQLNQSLQLQNQTLVIVNNTAQNVQELVVNGRRMRTWMTQ